MKEKIAFRCDAGRDIGFGHLKRCLVLAKELEKRMDIFFISKSETNAIDMIKRNKFEVIQLDNKIGNEQEIDKIKEIINAQSINKILIDLKKNISKGYIRRLKETGTKTILLDNIGEGRLEADVVIYPVAHSDETLFKGIQGELYHGWSYILIDKEFFGKRKKINKDKTRILVSMGGSDVHNITPKIINELRKIDRDFECTVVIGPGFKNQSIKVDDDRFMIKKNVSNMAELMLNSSIGIILFGVSAYEAAAARLPCILITDSARNKKAAEKFKEFGTCIYSGGYKELNKNKIASQAESLLENTDLRRKMKITAQILKMKNLISSVI